jgi:hypothetical protein
MLSLAPRLARHGKSAPLLTSSLLGHSHRFACNKQGVDQGWLRDAPHRGSCLWSACNQKIQLGCSTPSTAHGYIHICGTLVTPSMLNCNVHVLCAPAKVA